MPKTPLLAAHPASFAAVLAAAAGAALLLALPLAAVAQGAVKEVLTPAQYFECQLAAQRATVQGLEERLQMRARVNLTAAEKSRAGEAARQRVTVAMYACGQQNASTLGAYAARNAEQLQTWLNAHPQMQARLEASARRVAELSQQMPAVSPSAKR